MDVEWLSKSHVKSTTLDFFKKFNKPPFIVFLLLELDEETDTLRYIQLLEIWVEYMKKTNIETKKVISVFHDDTGLKILESLSQIKDSEKVVESIQNSLVSYWFSGHKSASEVFASVSEGSTLSYVAWIKFVKAKFNDPNSIDEITKLLVAEQKN